MNVYDLIQGLIGAESYDKIKITDGTNEYDLDYVRADNGFVELNIIPILNLNKESK